MSHRRTEFDFTDWVTSVFFMVAILAWLGVTAYAVYRIWRG